MDQVRVSLEREELLAGRGVPQLRRLVAAPRDNARTVAAERHTPYRSLVPAEDESFLTGRGVPHRRIRGLVAGDDALAVGAERHGFDLCLLLQCDDFLAPFAVPHPHRPVDTAGDD